MKKIIALLLCLALAGSCAAVAETAEKELIGTLNVNGTFNIRCKLAEGYKLSIRDSGSTYLEARVSTEDVNKPEFTVSIAFNEEYTLEDGTAQRLNDVSPEVMDEIRESFYEGSDVVESFEESETAHGTKVLIVKGVIGSRNYVGVYSIYQSYEVEVIAYANPESEATKLTDDQIQIVLDFLSNMDFEAV